MTVWFVFCFFLFACVVVLYLLMNAGLEAVRGNISRSFDSFILPDWVLMLFTGVSAIVFYFVEMKLGIMSKLCDFFGLVLIRYWSFLAPD